MTFHDLFRLKHEFSKFWEYFDFFYDFIQNNFAATLTLIHYKLNMRNL